MCSTYHAGDDRKPLLFQTEELYPLPANDAGSHVDAMFQFASHVPNLVCENYAAVSLSLIEI